jgi:hypothetical protein
LMKLRRRRYSRRPSYWTTGSQVAKVSSCERIRHCGCWNLSRALMSQRSESQSHFNHRSQFLCILCLIPIIISFLSLRSTFFANLRCIFQALAMEIYPILYLHDFSEIREKSCCHFIHVGVCPSKIGLPSHYVFNLT